MQNSQPEKRESYAIDDDEIDVRLIQRQIANVMTQSSKTDKKSSSEGGDSENKTTEIPPLLEPAKKSGKILHSKEDSLDINELMNDGEGNFSLDLLEQLTSKINSEFNLAEEQMDDNTEPEPEPQPEPEEVEEVEETANVEYDENEENINSVEANEELHIEETMNQENEKTIVTEQICEYPINAMDSEYIQTLDYLEGDKRYKKFVIYINEENIDYINSLSIQERKDVINSILREQDDLRISRREEERRRKLITHLLIGIITFVVFIPFLYFLVNKCLEATIENYRRSQNNFEVLYKERGKIKTPASKY